ncbi:hypothetical protein CDIK_1170, partial [Cucumispora dikerogammari]
FLMIDESYIQNKKILLCLIGLIENPKELYCGLLKVVQECNFSTIYTAVEELICRYKLNKKIFRLVLTDAASYMKKATNHLKIEYPQLKNISCKAHLFHNCAMLIKASFENVNSLIASIKSITIKNKTNEIKLGAIDKLSDVVIIR